MDNKIIKLYNLAFDNLYNLKYQGRNSSLLNAKIEMMMDDLKKEALSFGYDFYLNDKNQKFRLLKIKK